MRPKVNLHYQCPNAKPRPNYGDWFYDNVNHYHHCAVDAHKSICIKDHEQAPNYFWFVMTDYGIAAQGKSRTLHAAKCEAQTACKGN
jgi:hypothetical protein